MIHGTGASVERGDGRENSPRSACDSSMSAWYRDQATEERGEPLKGRSSCPSLLCASRAACPPPPGHLAVWLSGSLALPGCLRLLGRLCGSHLWHGPGAQAARFRTALGGWGLGPPPFAARDGRSGPGVIPTSPALRIAPSLPPSTPSRAPPPSLTAPASDAGRPREVGRAGEPRRAYEGVPRVMDFPV